MYTPKGKTTEDTTMTRFASNGTVWSLRQKNAHEEAIG